jgi:CHAD domain-containing protein
MAKARAIEGLDGAQPYAAAAAKVVAARAAEVAEHADGVLDTNDIERLHDMRVATRRLRAAMEMFEACFPKKPFRGALAEVKQLADALGERRDPDVAIALLGDFAERLPAGDRPGVQSLVVAYRREQSEANEALAPYVTPERLAALGAQVRELVAAAGER